MLVILLIIYYIITLVNTNYIVDQIYMIANHPYPVAIAIGKVNTGLAQLNSLPERLFTKPNSQVIDTVRDHFDTIDESMTENISFIMDKYTVRPEDATHLQQYYLELREVQDNLIDLCVSPLSSDEDIEAYYKEYMVPIIDELYLLTEAILYGSQTRFIQLEQLATDTRISTIILSTILTLSVLLALSIYLRILNEKSKVEERMQETLREALSSAQSANAAKSQFLFNMSHDIRTPMNAIIGMTAIATMHLEEPQKVKNCLGKISASSKHLLGLINEVLDMSKIESGKIALNNEEFVMPEFIHNFITIIQPQIKAKQLDLDISIDQLSHERLIGDTLRLNQILLNIVGNAIKFTPAGGYIHIKICESPAQINGYGSYQFQITDNGIGMSEEFLKKIFYPFERAQTSTNSKIEGTGLGMAITKNIVDMMNGQITVRSRLEEGTTFTVSLPLEIQKIGDEDYDFTSLRELRSLVVDDDRDVCENTVKMLEDIGMKSEWVLTGAEAVVKTAAAHESNTDYHSVIIDWKMPEMDGLETTRRIRSAVGEDIPIIILTAYDWTDIEEEAKEAGVNAFLAKPLFKSNLYHVMHDVITGERQHLTAPLINNIDIDIKCHVLIVEDNEINMEIAMEFIQLCGCTADAAWDGREAVQMVKKAPNGYYKLIYMDVQMPHMDGYEATQQIRELEQAQNRRHTPIIAMSANAFVEDVDKAYASGMDGYITKPINLEEIRRNLIEFIAAK